MPGNILDHRIVCPKDAIGIKSGRLLGIAGDVPETDSGVLGTGDEMTGGDAVPGHAVALGRMTLQTNVGIALIGSGRKWMFGIVKDVNLPSDTAGSDKTWILRHITSTVNFAVVRDALGNVDFCICAAITTNFTRCVVKLARVDLCVGTWQLHGGDLQKIGVAIGRMRTQK